MLLTMRANMYILKAKGCRAAMPNHSSKRETDMLPKTQLDKDLDRLLKDPEFERLWPMLREAKRDRECIRRTRVRGPVPIESR